MVSRKKMLQGTVAVLMSVLFSVVGTGGFCQAAPGGPWDGDGGHDADYSDIPRLRWMGPGSPGTYRQYLQGRADGPVSVSRGYQTPAGDGGRGTLPLALVLVEGSLLSGIQANLDLYVAGLESQGYSVEVHEVLSGTAAGLKFFITNHATDLAGCVFVGDLPAAWYEADIWDHEEFPCDLYFMDLDGTWLDADGDGLFDSHTAGGGDVGPEIFVGRIDTSMMSGDEVQLTNEYLEKNLDYRSGGIYAPKYALSYTEDDWAAFADMRTDIQFAYPDFDDIPAPATNRDDYVDNRLPSAEYEFIQLCCHSSPDAHYFTRGGQAYSSEIQATVPHAMFYNLFCCSTLRFTSPDYLGGAYIYDTGQTSLAVIGSTKTGSMLTFSAFYQPFGAGECFGESFRQWFNYLAPYNDDEIAWHYGMTIAGDPFLAMVESAMSVTPTSGFEPLGEGGGPFTPSSMVYTLENHSDSGFNYSVSCNEPWLTLSETTGYLAADDTATITVSVNAAAETLPIGRYEDTISFVNTTTHNGDTTRPAALQVGLPAVQYQWTMDSDPGWTAEGQWAHGTPSGGGGEYGNPDPVAGFSGSHVCGYNLDGDYPADLPETHLTTAAIDCSDLAFVSVRFQRWLNVETPVYDHAYLRASNDGSAWVTVWENGDEITDAAWHEVSYDLSAVADDQPTVYLRWTMGATDSGWQYSGWNIDDVAILGVDTGVTPPPETVSTGIDCLPDSGQLPFVTQISVGLANLTVENRRAAARIDLTTGAGGFFANWRAGWTNLGPAELFSAAWNQNLPGLSALAGQNSFAIVAEDVTPAPFNQPPYAPSGDTDTDQCVVTATAP